MVCVEAFLWDARRADGSQQDTFDRGINLCRSELHSMDRDGAVLVATLAPAAAMLIPAYDLGESVHAMSRILSASLVGAPGLSCNPEVCRIGLIAFLRATTLVPDRIRRRVCAKRVLAAQGVTPRFFLDMALQELK